MDHYRAISALIDSYFEQETEFLQQLVRIPSNNPYTADTAPPDAAVEKQIAACIYRRMQDLGFSPTFHGVTPERPNVLATIEGADQSGKTLILTTHMDTVEPSSGYTCDPFGAVIEDGKMFGLGVADAKAQIAAFLYAVYAVRQAGLRLKGHVKLAFVVDEEAGACSPYGTRYLLEQGLLRGDAAIVGEPGDRKIATGHRGVYRFRLETLGEAVHTGLREWEQGARGRNAAVDMARLTLALSSCQISYTPSPSFPGRRPVITFPTLISGGKTMNMVPDRCVAYGEVRLLPGISEENIKRQLSLCLNQTGIPYSLKTVAYVPATEIPLDAEIVQVLGACIETVTSKIPRCEGVGPACDGWMFIERGIPTVCGYGVACGGVHGADEWIDLESLRQITEIYARTILGFLNGAKE